MKTHINAYKKLLISDESLETLDSCVSLFEIVSGYSFKFKEHETELQELEKDRILEQENWIKASYFDGNFNREEFERVIHRKLKKRERLIEQSRIFKVYALLSQSESLINDNVGLDSTYSFIHDILLLVFHNAYFSLLPRLETTDWAQERKMLIHSFFKFSSTTPNMADKFRVLGFAFAAIHEIEEAVKNFRVALHQTHVDEHDFITRLQSLWMFLLDHCHFEEALKLLLDEYKRVQRKDVDEVGAMILQTFEEQRDFYTKRNRAQKS